MNKILVCAVLVLLGASFVQACSPHEQSRDNAELERRIASAQAQATCDVLLEREQQVVNDLLAQGWEGESLPLLKARWIESVGPNSDHDSCLIGVHEGDRMQAIGVSEGRVLYEYLTSEVTLQNQCPSGTLYFSE